MERPSQLIATACGVRATCAATNTGTDTGAHRLGQHRPVTDRIQAGVLTGIEQIDRRQPPCRVGGDRLHHPPPPLDQRLDAGRVEHVGAKLHRPADPGRRTGLAPALGQRKHQIHAGGVGVGRQRGDPQITQRQPGGGVIVCPGRFCQASITCTSG